MHKTIFQLITHRNTLMILALALGFLFGDFAFKLEFSLIYLLSLMMTLSLQGVSHRIFSDKKKVIKSAIGAIIISYLIFGALIMGVGLLFFWGNSNILIGFFLIAIAPPGVVIIPFAISHKCDLSWSIVGVVSGYFLALAIIPISLFIIGENSEIVSTKSLFNLLFWSIILPMGASRLLRYKPIIKQVSRIRGIAINLVFFVLIYTIIGMNKTVFQEDIGILLKIALILIVTLFGGTYLLGYFAVRWGFNRSLVRAQQLMFGIKNNGFSAILAISIGQKEMALPSIVLSIVLLIFLVFFDLISTKGEG